MGHVVSAPAWCQRWRARRDAYRRPDEPIRTLEHEVAEIPDDTTARAFVERHHYSGSYPAARARYGLYRGAALVGVAVFSHPANDRVVTNLGGGLGARDGMELGRFVLLDEVAGNGETWFLARCFELLRARGDVAAVVSFSDPCPRSCADGRVLFAGHVGTIYQAHNAAYLGRGTSRTLRLLPDGTVFSDRAAQKIRARERGWRYAAAKLVLHGARDPVDGEDLGAWLRAALALVTRTMRHPGNHRYAWPIGRRNRRLFDAPDPARYPKREVPS